MKNNGIDNQNKNNDFTGENNSFHAGGMIGTFRGLREEIVQVCKELKQPLNKVLVLSQNKDPYYIASDMGIEKAIWAARLFNECLRQTKQTEIHTRGVHYFIVMMKKEPVYPPHTHPNMTWEVYENTSTCYNYLKEGLQWARYFHLIPYSSVVDEKNDVLQVTVYADHNTDFATTKANFPLPILLPYLDITLPEVIYNYDTFEEYYNDCIKQLAYELFNGNEEELGINFSNNIVKPFRIELWSEKTLPRYIKTIGGVDTIVEGGGELSITLAREFIEKLNKYEQDGVILYVSDFDPKGNDMPVSIARKIQAWKRTGELNQNAYLIPILLTKEQVVKYDLPQVPISSDKRKKLGSAALRFDHKAGEGFTELQALEVMPEIYKQIVKESVDEWTVTKTDDEIKKRKEEIMEKLKDCIDVELSKHKDELKDQYNEFKEHAEGIEEALPDINDIQRQYVEAEEIADSNDIEDRMRNKLTDISKNIELPEVEPPKLEEQPPVNCLYDSRRDDIKQTVLLNMYKVTGEWR